MKVQKTLFRATLITSLIFGFVLCFTLAAYSTYICNNPIQYGLLGFLIGFPMIWLVYLAVWFVTTGFRKTAFPALSALIVSRLKNASNISLTVHQEKMLVEMAGTALTIAAVLVLAGVVAFLYFCLIYIAGSINL